MVKTLSPATATLEKPEPTPVAFQTTGGPSLGHSLSRPLSDEMSSRLGPRNCGQSADGDLTSAAWHTAANSTTPQAKHQRDMRGISFSQAGKSNRRENVGGSAVF